MKQAPKAKESKQDSETPTTSLRLSAETKRDIEILGATFGEKNRQVIERAISFLKSNLKQAVLEDNERRLKNIVEQK